MQTPQNKWGMFDCCPVGMRWWRVTFFLHLFTHRFIILISLMHRWTVCMGDTVFCFQHELHNYWKRPRQWAIYIENSLATDSAVFLEHSLVAQRHVATTITLNKINIKYILCNILSVEKVFTICTKSVCIWRECIFWSMIM